MPDTRDITQLLAAWSGGDREALNALMPVVMDELKRIAAAYLAREPHAQTLQTTALVNEAYLRLVNVRATAWEAREQFFAPSAQIMRRILVDHARAQLALGAAESFGVFQSKPLWRLVPARAARSSPSTKFCLASRNSIRGKVGWSNFEFLEG